MLQASTLSDVDASGMEFLRTLRDNSDLLLLDAEDPWTAYQTQLRKMHNFGILNLSLTLVGTNKLPLEQLTADKEHQVCSLAARLRERKKNKAEVYGL